VNWPAQLICYFAGKELLRKARETKATPSWPNIVP